MSSDNHGLKTFLMRPEPNEKPAIVCYGKDGDRDQVVWQGTEEAMINILRRWKAVEKVLEDITAERRDVLDDLNKATDDPNVLGQYFNGINYTYGRLINAMKGELP